MCVSGDDRRPAGTIRATSPADVAIQEEVRNAARMLIEAVRAEGGRRPAPMFANRVKSDFAFPRGCCP